MRPLNLPEQSYREAGVRAVDVVVPQAARGGAATVAGQHVLTRPLEVERAPVKCVVVRVSKHCAHTRLCREREIESETHTHTHIYTYIHTQIYIYIFIYIHI